MKLLLFGLVLIVACSGPVICAAEPSEKNADVAKSPGLSGPPDDPRAAANTPPELLNFPCDEKTAMEAQAAWARHLAYFSVVEKNSIEMDLVLIPPGKFAMGPPRQQRTAERLLQNVEVTISKAFFLGKTEVTQAQWQKVMEPTPWKKERNVRQGDNHAASYINWDDAVAFCEKLGQKEGATYRLPTEAEWEYACRAGTTTRFGFGNGDAQMKQNGWYRENAWDAGDEYAHEVGLKTANAFGLYDMHGNVWEWCQDIWVAKLPGGADPLVSQGGENRVIRGGSWRSIAAGCQSADRHSSMPVYRYDALGFRVVRVVSGK